MKLTFEDWNRLARLYRIFDELDLPHSAIVALLEANTAAGLPYHGAAHGISVALRAHDFGAELGVSRFSAKTLVIAGLLHDADYVVGESETINLARAAAFARWHGGLHGDPAAELIYETEFPHHEPDTLLGAIIQDADLLQCQDRDRDRWLNALEQETGRPALADFPTASMLNTSPGRTYLALSR
ncbi:HD domain-containing protein [Microbacterium sp. 77mftsu3.1]|uniref:HD domain-containing protein n=1 Tax=Microbacterium sp. 77mftsu3.1 TaxID=1761802 RepID=UPI00036AF6F1|nr:HD domain-containing protein [Microbacterium sp. 77mftsu3.1]SDH47301.1 hypothetical protein SAMN04488590_3368 [Microbacterium sp. 77mftsu3.1]